MARRLQREYSLPVLRVSLVQDGPTPVAEIELVVNQHGRQRMQAGTRCALDTLGFGASIDSRDEPRLYIPPHVGEWIAERACEITEDGPLWLHLKKPYGLLGAVPWERDVQPLLQSPLLRLPDVLPERPRSGSTFHVALCVPSALSGAPVLTSEMVPVVVRALANGVGERLRLHVFADIEPARALERDLLPAHLGETIVHRPEPDVGTDATAGRRSQDPWLRWIRHEMDGQALDAVHFIAHGCTLGTEGAILTISATDRGISQTLQAAELRTFLTQVGASVAGFTAPYDNYSDYGLLKLVDDLGAVRAGPVLMHDPRLDQSMTALTDAYDLLSATYPGRPVGHRSLVLFAQPRQVGSMTHGTLAFEFELGRQPMTLAPSQVVSAHLDSEDTPLWIAAAERYISDNEAKLFRFWEQRRDRQEPTSTELAYYDGLESALTKIRSVIDRHAESS